MTSTDNSSTIPSELPQVTIFCDGACRPNPGNGGIGVVMIYGTHRREYSRSIGSSTNQQAEIIAACEALNLLKFRCAVEIISDSRYLISTMNGEYSRKTNLPLWHTLDAAVSRHVCRWTWIRGHNGDPNNERADALAEAAAVAVNPPLFEDA